LPFDASNSMITESSFVEKKGTVVTWAEATSGTSQIATRRKTKHAPAERRGHDVAEFVVSVVSISG